MIETAPKPADRTLATEPPTAPPDMPSVMAFDSPRRQPTAGLEVRDLSAYYGSFRAIRNVTLRIPDRAVTAIIGPSGCGKSTFLRSLNRMHELTPDARTEGGVELLGVDVYDPAVDPVQLRRVVGMVFQRPESVPDHVDLRQRGGRVAADRPKAEA